MFYLVIMESGTRTIAQDGIALDTALRGQEPSYVKVILPFTTSDEAFDYRETNEEEKAG